MNLRETAWERFERHKRNFEQNKPSWMAINPRGRAALLRADFESVDKAAKLSDENLLLIDGVGAKTLREIRAYDASKNQPLGINLEPR